MLDICNIITFIAILSLLNTKWVTFTGYHGIEILFDICYDYVIEYVSIFPFILSLIDEYSKIFFTINILYLVILILINIICYLLKVRNKYYLLISIFDCIISYYTYESIQQYLMYLSSSIISNRLLYWIILFRVYQYYSIYNRVYDYIWYILTVIIVSYSFYYMVYTHSIYIIFGFPCGIDYLLLFFSTNYYISSYEERRWNRVINSMRCIVNILYSIIYIYSTIFNSYIEYIKLIFILFCSYYKYIYFLEHQKEQHSIYEKKIN